MEYILKNIPAYQSATEELDQASKQWQSEVEKLGKKPKVCMIAIRHLLRPFPTHRSQKRRRDCCQRKISRELRRKYFGPEGELFKKREALMQPIQDEIYEAVKAISTQKATP